MAYYDEDGQRIWMRNGKNAMLRPAERTETSAEYEYDDPAGATGSGSTFEGVSEGQVGLWRDRTVTERPSGWEEQRTGNASASGTRAWQEALNAQNAERYAQNQRLFDGYMGIVQTAKRDIAMDNQRRHVAGAAMLQSAYDNPNGMSDRALSQSLSEAVGQPIYGCQILRGLSGDEAKMNGWAALYGAVKDQQSGQERMGIVGLIDQESQLGILQGAKAGDRTAGTERMLWGAISKRLTPEQMSQRGLRNPDALHAVGQTTISGSMANRLFGRPQQRSSISAFGADGKGGFTNYESNAGTGYRLESEDGGTRAGRGRWKQVSVGPSDTFDGKKDKTQVRVYENSETGEQIRVKDGENLRDVLAKSENRKGKTGQASESGVEIAKINAASREKIAGMENETKVKIAAAGKGASKPMSEAERNKEIGAASANLENLKEQLSALEEKAKDQSVPMAEVSARKARLEAAINEQQKTLDALSGIPSAAAATSAPKTPDADAVKAAKAIKAKMAVGGAKKGAAGSAAAGETPTGEAGAGAEKIGGSSADAGTEPGAGDKTAASHSENDDEDKKLEMAEGKMDASFRNDGGEIAVKDGEKRYVLRGLEYLSDEECKRLGIDRKNNVVDYIDANVADVQKSAAKAKKAFEKTRSKAIEDIRRKARSLYPNSKAKREKYVSTEANAWEAKNDPSVKAKLRQGLSEQLPTMM